MTCFSISLSAANIICVHLAATNSCSQQYFNWQPTVSNLMNLCVHACCVSNPTKIWSITINADARLHFNKFCARDRSVFLVLVYLTRNTLHERLNKLTKLQPMTICVFCSCQKIGRQSETLHLRCMYGCGTCDCMG